MPPIPTNAATQSGEVLRFYLTYSPPDHALWKSIEWRLFREYDYPAPVLDLGCGDGIFAKLVFPSPLTAGIDILGGRVRKAQRVGQHRLPVQGDATVMPFSDSSFATVFSGCAMEHIPPLPDMLCEIARILQPGGRLITTVPSGYFRDYLFIPGILRRFGMPGLARRYADLVPRLLAMVHLYHPAFWEKSLADAGLELESARHFLPTPVTQTFDKLLIIGNLLQPLMLLIRGSALHRRYVDMMYNQLLPYLTMEGETGGALLIVARKPAD
ncbi:MAG: hypothetical protein NVS4B8_11320 [Herpetosiphon sp.]